MADYRAPVQESLFVIDEMLDICQLNQLDRFSEVNRELLDAVLEQAGKFAAEVFAPLNRIGDQLGSKVVDNEVITPDGFREAYQQFVDNAWLSLAQDSDYGGQDLPFVVHMAVTEYWNSANMSLALCPMLTAGAIDALHAHASDTLKKVYLPKLVTGEWTGTMNLTESHAGSDLANLKTKASPNGDHYLIKGQKVFITWGEHDLCDNIVHLVLAPTVDAPSGIKGLSLFLVPKFLVNDDGSIGERNDVKVVSIEHKMGINASPTCVMSFGDESGAIGYLVGEEGQGLACMFTLMNHARLEVGLEGVAMGERARIDALEYAKERIQGRHPLTGEPAAIIEHADVQRMLMHMRSMTEAMRALCCDAGLSHDLRMHSTDADQQTYHNSRFALLTPIAKAWCTEVVNEVASLGIQVHGGMGYIEETGVAQHYRDARIASIYEGTNGIQANDFVGRKLIADGGVGLRALVEEIDATLKTAFDLESLSFMASSVNEAKQALLDMVDYVLANAKESPKFSGAVAYNTLMQTGYTLGAWYHLRAAIIAHAQMRKSDHDFYMGKLASARFYISQILPRSGAYYQAVISGAKVGAELEAKQLDYY